jgi:hypothetical protein
MTFAIALTANLLLAIYVMTVRLDTHPRPGFLKNGGINIRDYGYWVLVTSVLAFMWTLATTLVVGLLSFLTNANAPLNDPWLLLSGGLIAVPITASSMYSAMNSN